MKQIKELGDVAIELGRMRRSLMFGLNGLAGKIVNIIAYLSVLVMTACVSAFAAAATFYIVV